MLILSCCAFSHKAPFMSWFAMQQYLAWLGKRQVMELKVPLVSIILVIFIWLSYYRMFFAPLLQQEWLFCLLNLTGKCSKTLKEGLQDNQPVYVTGFWVFMLCVSVDDRKLLRSCYHGFANNYDWNKLKFIIIIIIIIIIALLQKFCPVYSLKCGGN